MNKQRAKTCAIALAIGAMPLGLSGTCIPFTGSLNIFRDDFHDDFYVEEFFYEDDFYYYEDDCLFFDCGF